MGQGFAFLLFLNGRQYPNTSKVSWAGAVKRERWRNSGGGGAGSLRLQRKEKDIGGDPEHRETGRESQSVLRKRSEGRSRGMTNRKGWRGGRKGVLKD